MFRLWRLARASVAGRGEIHDHADQRDDQDQPAAYHGRVEQAAYAPRRR